MHVYQRLYWNNYLYILYNSNLEREHINCDVFDELEKEKLCTATFSWGAGMVDLTEWPGACPLPVTRLQCPPPLLDKSITVKAPEKGLVIDDGPGADLFVVWGISTHSYEWGN